MLVCTFLPHSLLRQAILKKRLVIFYIFVGNLALYKQFDLLHQMMSSLSVVTGPNLNVSDPGN